MRSKRGGALAGLLAILGGGVFAAMIYYLLAVLLNFPLALAVGLAVIVGGFQYFIFRFIFLTLGEKKDPKDEI